MTRLSGNDGIPWLPLVWVGRFSLHDDEDDFSSGHRSSPRDSSAFSLSKYASLADEKLIPSLLGSVDPGHGDIKLRTAPLATSMETPAPR
jgi:hypothetical protein